MLAKFTAEEQYLNIIRDIINVADVTPDRTGTGRIRVFARDIRCDLSDGSLPLITTRKINYEHGIEELLWLISGSSNINSLKDNTKPIWKNWAIQEKDIESYVEKFFPDGDPDAKKQFKESLSKKHLGSIGKMYGSFWRNNESNVVTSLLPLDSLDIKDIPSDKLNLYKMQYDELEYFKKVATAHNAEDVEELPSFELWAKVNYFESNDQLGEVIRGIKHRPYSARHCISVWIPQYTPFESVYTPQENVLIGKGALTPCHVFSQFFIEKARDGGPDYISLRLTQRSCDMGLGVPTNLLEYAVFLHMVAHCTDLRVKEFIWSGGDCHLYSNMIEGAVEQVSRVPLSSARIAFNPKQKDIFAMTREDIEIIDYKHHEPIKFKVSI